MRALVAFDKFKDALSAPVACELTARALQEQHPDWTVDVCPLTDGGEGFCEILTRAAGGEFAWHEVTGPRGDPIRAPVGYVGIERIPPAARAMLGLAENAPRGPHTEPTVAIIEMATASGLALLSPAQRDPWQTSTAGTGQLIGAAADKRVAAIVLGVGGSATSDLGLGALEALGVEFMSAHDLPVHPVTPVEWPRIARLQHALPPLPPIRIACDVTNPLLGPRGAAAIYGPQKGLRAEDLPRFEHSAARLALLLCHHFQAPDSLMDQPGAGAAGGISFGLMAATGARLLPGFDLVTAWFDLDARLAAADIVITGEGRFDESSLSGKGPGAVAARGLARGKQVHVFAGAVTTSGATAPGLTLHAITPAGAPLAEALRSASENLGASVRRAFASSGPTVS